MNFRVPYLRLSVPHLCLLLLVLLSSVARAQELKASLLTIGPGEEVYELFGHNAIVFDNAGLTPSNEPIAFNWGMFDFDQPNFVGRFIMGRMLYSIGAMPEKAMIAEYEQQHRMMVKTPLNLTPEQTRKLLDLCLENYNTPALKNYRYDYYRDNCSSRVRDMIDKATDGAVAAALKDKPAAGTFRWHTDRLSTQTPWLYVGLHYVLGHPVDQPIDAWSESFLPARLHGHLKASLPSLMGEDMTLVPDSSGRGLDAPAGPPEWKVWFLLAGVLWGGAIAGLVTRGNNWARRGGLLLITGWALLCLIGGSVSTWGWLFTDHAVSRNNENWLQLSPISGLLLLAALVAFIGRPKKWVASKFAGRVAVFVLALSVFGVLIKVLPMMSQPNWEIILLAVPLHLATAFALRSVQKRVS